MAKVHSGVEALVSGKTNKKLKEIHRVIKGKEYVYSIENPNTEPPSKAQKAHRSLFGKINSIVNQIMADPALEAEWNQRMIKYNADILATLNPALKRYQTTREFAYAMIRQQLENQPAAKRRKAKLPYQLPRGIKLQIKPFSDLSASEIYEILKARFEVFVREQNIRYLDEDNIDYVATHLSLRKKGRVIAYARLYQTADKNTLQIGRLLTMERHKGFGRFLMEQAIQEAKRQGATTIRIHAQIQTVAFYEQLGFQTCGDIFQEADIPHICMEIHSAL